MGEGWREGDWITAKAGMEKLKGKEEPTNLKGQWAENDQFKYKVNLI